MSVFLPNSFLSSDGRTDEAMARDVRGGEWEGVSKPADTSVFTTEAASETGVGSERSSPSEADLYELLAVADVRFRLNVRLFMEALEEPPLFLRRAG